MGGLNGRLLRSALVGAVLAGGVLGADILETSGFSSCNANADVSVQKVDIKYNNEDKTVSFDVAGSSNKVQNVTAVLEVTAYGQTVYSNSFNPCDEGTFVDQLCPVPAGNFSAKGTQKIPDQYADMVPAIAFQVPDIAAMAKLQLQSKESGDNVACIQSQVTNGKTASLPAVSYVAAGIAGAALVLGGVSAMGAAMAGGGSAAAGGGSAAGAGTPSPTFTEVCGWFQSMAMNGMMSVNYPSVYRNFAKNFGFSTGLVSWRQMQLSIDDFRAATGGNLTNNSVEFLEKATLVYPDGYTQTPGQSLGKRGLDELVRLVARQIETSVNGTLDESGSSSSPGGGVEATVHTAVSGFQGFVEQYSVPSGNTFMTVLLVVAIVVAAIVVGILLVKVILEFWALFGSFPKSLVGFRKHYWRSIARAITSLILLLYGIWVLYCVFQFTQGDSWAAKVLAGVTLFLFTAVLAFFSWKIWSTARRLKAMEGDVGALYEDKKIWVKYSLFYESYRRDYWWIFVPTIIYMFAKGCVLAAADGHGMAQTIAQLIVEGIMLCLLLWSRPYERRSSNFINICIQVVRVLSVVCILVFVEEFGIAQTTQTVTGVVLIALQSALTGILAILIAWNAIIACCKENPHRKRRKEMEKMHRDTLTPLDPRNSLLMDRHNKRASAANDLESSLSLSKTGYAAVDSKQIPLQEKYATSKRLSSKPSGYTPLPLPDDNSSREDLVTSAAPFGGVGGGGGVMDSRQPTLPHVGAGAGYRQPQTGYGGGYQNGYRVAAGGGYGGY